MTWEEDRAAVSARIDVLETRTAQLMVESARLVHSVAALLEAHGAKLRPADEPPAWATSGASSTALSAFTLARLVQAVEWKGYVDFVGDGGYACCPWCSGIAPDDADKADAMREVERGNAVVGHRPDCPASPVFDAIARATKRAKADA
jgi:hypothetical protein